MPCHIEKDSIQETLIIPLFGRLICSEHYPELFSDPSAARIFEKLDYDFYEKRKLMESQAGLFGALEAAQRQYDLLVWNCIGEFTLPMPEQKEKTA